jgi:uncharacterized protein YndB with AHSA1/START domain
MAATRHVYEVYVRAAPERVWQAITDPAFTTRYFHRTAFESALEPGSAYRYTQPDGSDALVGEIVDVEPERRLVMTFRMVYDASLADEPPSRVEWVLTPVGDGHTRLTLRHGDLALSPRTWAKVRLGWTYILDSMKSLLETGEALGDIDDPEADLVPDDIDGSWHRAQGVAANNATWDVLGTPAGERMPEANEAMVRTAYAAAYHWSLAAGRGPENEARAEWLLSRVWAVRGNGQLALHHADRCSVVTAVAGLTDFDLAYSLEARARALACLGRDEEALAALDDARSVAIADDEDRKILDDDLRGGPWFGLMA